MSEFYLQDKRSYVGNDLMFWAKGGRGYTTDLSKAEVYTRDAAFRQHESRDTDVPWPKEYIDARVRPAVDMQYVDIIVALDEVGEKLIPPPKPIVPIGERCYHCGKMISIKYINQNGLICPHCNGDNYP